MKRSALIIFILCLFAADTYAEVKEDKEPDTIFQKFATFINGGYEVQVEPVKKVTLFQTAADWVDGNSQKKPAETSQVKK